jgi:peptidoglycan L-alanyl-D-glutamate endopeptidase CwlK
VLERAVDILVDSESQIRFVVIEGVRSEARQRRLFAAGASTTLKSRHLRSKADGLAKAVDLIPVFEGEADAQHWPLFHELAKAIKEASKDFLAADDQPLADRLEWGGDWRTFKDGAHWQLNAKLYP